MIYELRQYQLYPNRINALSERFEKYTLDIYRKHNMVPIGFFREDIGMQGRFVDIIGYENLGVREKARAAFFADPEWRKIRDKSGAEGPTTVKIHNSILIPYPYSPMK